MIQQMVVLHKSIFWSFDMVFTESQLDDSPVPVSLSNDLPVFLRRFRFFHLPRLDIGYRLVRLVVFIEYGDIQSGIADLMSIHLPEARLAYLIDSTPHLLPPERLNGGFTAPPLTRPVGKYYPVVGQGSYKHRLAARAACLHLLLTKVGGIGKIVHFDTSE